MWAKIITIKRTKDLNYICHGSWILCFLLVSCSLFMCVWVCVGVPTHQRWSTIQLIQSSSSSAAAHHTTFKYSPLSHLLCQIVVCESRLCLIPSSFQSCAFFVPVRVPVDLSLWIRHVTSALVWPSKSLRHYPVSLWTAPIIICIGSIKREPTCILFPRFHHDRTIWPINGSSE